MPCPKCNAPDIQNAQVNYCYYCGYIFNPAIQKEKEKPDKALNIFVIIFSVNLFATIFYMILPYFMSAVSNDFRSSSYLTVFRFTNVFFGITDVILIFLVSAILKQKNLKVFFMVYAIARIILISLGIISWIWQSRSGIF